MKLFLIAAVLANGVLAGENLPFAERIFRPQRVTCGETSLRHLSLFDSAAWITHQDLAAEYVPQVMRVVRFRKTFTVNDPAMPLEFDVSADERFYLVCDGKFVARGPHRGTVDNWMFQSYRLNLEKGEHTLEAVVWKHTKGNAPHAQISNRLAFSLAAKAPYDKELTTGKAPWRAGIVEGVFEAGRGAGAWGVGTQAKIVGSGIYDKQPSQWKGVAVIKEVLPNRPFYCGTRKGEWQAYPTQLKDQLNRRLELGKCVDGDFSLPRTFPTNTTSSFLIDLGEYRCAYPEIRISGGKGASIEWKWAESLFHEKTNLKRNRGEWKGKYFSGFGDTFVSDGRDDAIFSPPWFRCGRWCRIVVKTAGEPLTVKDASIFETRYPLELETEFNSPQMPSLSPVQEICRRTMQMCAHEMLFDCPYYEQQMYPGDTRLQLNVISAMTSDDALVRRAIEFYDLGRKSDGLVPFNHPTTGLQDGLSYTLCYLLMHYDYMMLHNNREWFSARMPGYRNSLFAVEYYTRDDGLLGKTPGWTFVDWVNAPGWDFGNPPGALAGKATAQVNGLWLLALRRAEKIEESLGNKDLAAHWRNRAERLAESCRRVFWDEKKGLFADDPDKLYFSEHSQILMLLGGALEGDAAKACFEKLVSAPGLARTSVYFKYYLFETYFKFKCADLFFKGLGLWEDYLKLGCTTTIESPENSWSNARSDCHAWGSHPIYFLRAHVAGIRPDVPFFERVRIAPQPGHLKSIVAEWPHPSGKKIKVELNVDGEKISGAVATPVPGVFVWNGKEVEIKAGDNQVSL